MFTKKMRLLIIATFLFILGWTLYESVYEMSVAVAGITSLLIWGYFREGAVIMAAREFHVKNYDKAEHFLKESSNPEYLGKHRRGFYEFMYGTIELNRNNLEQAEYHFQIASNFPLRNSNDKAIVLMHLATINLRRKDHERATAYLEKAKNLKVSSRVKKVMEKLALELN